MQAMERLEADISYLQDLYQHGSEQLAGETSRFISEHAGMVSTQKDAVFAKAVEKFNQGKTGSSNFFGFG